MARLTADKWEQARADYEVRGISLGEIGKRYAVATSSVSRKAKAEGWTQGKMQELVERKVAVVKEMQEVETQTQELPLRFQLTLQEVVQERLGTEAAALNFARVVAQKGAEMAALAKTPDDIEKLGRAARNVMPQYDKGSSTTVNVTQQTNAQAQAAAAVVEAAPPDPDMTVRAALNGSLAGDD